ncbi:uncharacterized protein LOC129290855 isoform X2 [Prosopis cineraria]|uniref:uncharacterized protein LOC129290855 isoform X2 n=1 Tax=Prosopis cineraria TaxID=364024 RepID=UPI00240FD5C4|nr:uncharacterized protein LOC129290855 isoform X2 [Prosopis cineraria]
MQYQWVFGDFLSSKAEQDVFFEKRQATKWDVMSQRSEEQKELIRPHEALGMESSDATMDLRNEIVHSYKRSISLSTMKWFIIVTLVGCLFEQNSWGSTYRT